MEEKEVEVTPDKLYFPKDLVWVKISGMWWPCEVMDQETLKPEVTGGLKKKPPVVVQFLLEEKENSYEFVRSCEIIDHYNCERKEEFLALGFKKYFKLKNEKNMALFPTAIQEAERRTGGDPEIINDPKYRPQEAQGPSKVEKGGRSSLPVDFKLLKKSAPRRSAPGPSKDGDSANGVDKSIIRRPATVKQGPTWYPYPKYICLDFSHNRRNPPSDDPSVKRMSLQRCSMCCFESPYIDTVIQHEKSHQHVTTSAKPGAYHGANPPNKKKTASGSKKTTVRMKKDSASTSAGKGSAKKKKKVLPPVPVGEFTPPKKPKMSLPGTPNSLEVSQECAKIIEEWTDDEDENTPSDETVDKLGCSTSSIDNTMETTTEAADFGKEAETLPSSDASTPKIDKPSGPPKSSSCFDFDEEEPSEPGLQSSGKFGQIRLPRVITPEKSKPPDPLGDGNDIDSLLKEVSVPDIPSLPPAKQDSLFSRGDRTYGSSPFKDMKKPGITSPVRSDSSKDKNADVENNKNEEKHFLAKGPLQSKKRKSFGRTEGAEDGSDAENKSQAGASPLKPSNKMKIDGKTPEITHKTSAAEIAKQSLIDTLTYSPKPDDQVQEIAEPKKLPEDKALPNEPTVDSIDPVQSTLKPSRKSGRKKYQESAESSSLSVNEICKREASPEESESPGSTHKHKKLKSSRKMPKLDSASNPHVTQDSIKSPSTVDISDWIRSTPKQSRKSSRKTEHTEPPSLPLERTSKSGASLKEPGLPRSSTRNKKFKSSAEMPELKLVEGGTSKAGDSEEITGSEHSPCEHAPSDITRSKKTKEIGSPKEDQKVQPELQLVPEDNTLTVGVNQETTDSMKSPSAIGGSDSVQSASRKASGRKSMSQKPTESLSLPVEGISKREASPEEAESPRSSQRNKKFKSSQEAPELLSAPLDSTSKVEIAQDGVDFMKSPSSKQVISYNDITHESVVESPPRQIRKSKKLGSSEVELNAQPDLSEMPKLPKMPGLLSVPDEGFPKAVNSQNSAESMKSPATKQVLLSNDMVQEREVEKSPRASREIKKGEPKVQSNSKQPAVPVDDTSKADINQDDAETGSSLPSKQALPSNDTARSKKSRKLRSSSGEERKVHPDTLDLLSIQEDSTLNAFITHEKPPSIEYSSREQLLPSNDVIQEPGSLKSPRECRNTKKHGSSETELEEVVRDHHSLKESPEIDEPHESNWRSQTNRSQEVPVSIPLPDDCLGKSFSVDQNIPQESCESFGSPTSHSLISSQALLKVDGSPRVRSKRLNSQELPVSIPLPEGDFSSTVNTFKTPIEIPESITSPSRDEASHAHLVSLVNESLKSSKKSSKNLSTVEVTVSICQPEKNLPETLSSGELPKSDSNTTDLGGDSEALKSPPANETSTLVVPEAREQKSKKHKLPQEVPVPIPEVESVLELEEEPEPKESSNDDPVTLITEPMVCTDSKSQPSRTEEPYNVEPILAVESSEPLKSPSADEASSPMTENTTAYEVHVPSRKSRRIASQGKSESPCEVDTQTTETKANELSIEESRSPTLSQEPESALPSVGESATLKLLEELKPMESSKDDLMVLKDESVVFCDSKLQTLPIEEPLNLEGIPPVEDSEHLKSSSKNNPVILAEGFEAYEPVAPCRRSMRISSQEALTPKTVTKADDHPSKKSKRYTLSQEPEPKLSCVVDSDSLERQDCQDELKPMESSKDDPMALKPEAFACNNSKSQPSVAEYPHYVEAENSSPVKLPCVDKKSTQVLAEDSKANEPLTPVRKSKRISSQELKTSKSLFKVDSPKTDTIASEIPQGRVWPPKLPSCDEVFTSKVSVEDVPVIQEHPALHKKGNRQEPEKIPEAKPILEEDKPLTKKVPPSQEACEDLGKNVVGKLRKKETSPKPSSKKRKHIEPKLLPEVVTPKPDHKKVRSGVADSRSRSEEAKSKEKENTSHTKEKDGKAVSKSHRHEKSGRESRIVSMEGKDVPKRSRQEGSSRNESKTSKRGSASKEKKGKDQDEQNNASTSSFELISNKVAEKLESPQKVVKGAPLSPSNDAAPFQKSVSNDFIDSSSLRKKKSKWDADMPKVEETLMDTVETMKNADSNSGAMMNAGENTPSGLKPLEITVFDCSKNEVAIDEDLAVSSPKKQMAHSPSKTFRQDEAASLLEELLGSSPKSSPTSSPKKTKAVSSAKVPHDSPGQRSRTADIKFSLSPSKVLDFGSPPKANDASENMTENLGISPSIAESVMADASAAPVRASRWDSPIRSSGIRSSTPTQSLGVSLANTPHSPGRKVKVWEIKSGARSGFKSSLSDVAPDEPPKLPVHLDDSSNNQSDDEFSALQAEVMLYSAMDKAKSTPAPVVMKEVSDLAKELEDPPNSEYPKTTPAAIPSFNTVRGEKELFSSPKKSIDSTSHVSPEAIPLPPDNLPPFKPSGLSEADLLANLSSDVISIPLHEPVTAESVKPLAPDAVSSGKPSTTPTFIVVPPRDSTQGSDSTPCFGNEKQALGNGLAQNFGGGQDLREMLLDINSMPMDIIMDDNLAYSEAPVATVTESTSSPAVPIVSTEPVSSIPLPSETPFKTSPPISVVSSTPILTIPGQVQTSAVPVPSVQSISLLPEPSVQKPPAPELEEVIKEEIIETEIVMDHSETEQQDCLSNEEKFAQALVKQPWLRPDLLENLTKQATEKKVYEVKKVTQIVISLYDEDHPDYSYYMSLPPCQVGTSNYTPSWATAGAPKTTSSSSPTKTVSSATMPTSSSARQTPTANHSSASQAQKSIVTAAGPEKVGVEVADLSKPVSGASPAKAAGAQVKQKILQILNQFQSGNYDADTARKLESITSRPGFMDKINQQQKIMVSSQLPTVVNPIVRALPTAKTMTSMPGSPAAACPKSVMVVSTSRVPQPKPNILSAGREPLKFTMESKYRNIQVSNSNPTKYVVVPDPVTGIPAVKQQIIIRNTNTTHSGNTVSAGAARIVTTQTNSTASPGRIVATQANSAASPGPLRSTVPGTVAGFTMVSSRSTSTLQMVNTPGRSSLLGKPQITVPGSSTVKVTAPLPQPRQRLKTVAQPAVVPTARLSPQPQTVRVRKQSLGQTQLAQRSMAAKTETITYVTMPNNRVIPTSSEQVYVVTKKKPPIAPNSDILAEALAGAEIPFTDDPSPDLLSPSSVVMTGSLGADQLTMSFDPAETDNVNR